MHVPFSVLVAEDADVLQTLFEIADNAGGEG